MKMKVTACTYCGSPTTAEFCSMECALDDREAQRRAEMRKT